MISLKSPDNNIVCKYCGLNSISKCGTYNRIPRYLCKSCGRKFKLDDNLFYMRVPAEYVYNAMDMYYQGRQIKEIKTFLKSEYGDLLSRAAIYKWIRKFTDSAVGYFRHNAPLTGDVWIIGEFIARLQNKRMRIYDIVDFRTGFLLATLITPVRSVVYLKKLLRQAVRKAGKNPVLINAFINYSYFDKIKSIFKCQVQYISMQPQEIKYDIDLVKCMFNIHPLRINLMRGIRSPDAMDRVIAGWNVYYNYFLKQSRLDGRTPAEAAGIDYEIKSWKDFVIFNGAGHR